MKTRRMRELRERLDKLPCPYCSYEGSFLSLVGHALGRHRINLIARLASKGRKRRRPGRRKTALRFVKQSSGDRQSIQE